MLFSIQSEDGTERKCFTEERAAGYRVCARVTTQPPLSEAEQLLEYKMKTIPIPL